jgi:hypothetical protein
VEFMFSLEMSAASTSASASSLSRKNNRFYAEKKHSSYRDIRCI